MSKLITLKNGDLIRADVIYAILLEDGIALMPPRVIVKYGAIDHGNIRHFYFDTNEERDAYAAKLRAEIEAAVGGV